MSQTKTGRYSRYLKDAQLREMYETARADERLPELDEEAAILQGLIFDQFGKLDILSLDFDNLLKLVEKAKAERAELIEKLAAATQLTPNESDPETENFQLPGARNFSDVTVLKPRLSSRRGVYWVSARYWYAPAKLAGINMLNRMKDDLDQTAIELIVPELVDIARRTTLETFSGIVSAPAPRHSAFIGVAHFASELGRRFALATGNDFVSLFEPIPAAYRGHHPRREKDPPKLTDPALVKGKSVLLIDDVATSGQTLELHVKALRQAGAKVSALVWIHGETSGLGAG